MYDYSKTHCLCWLFSISDLLFQSVIYQICKFQNQQNSANVARVLNQPCGTDIAATYMPLIEIRYIYIASYNYARKRSHNIHGYYGILSIRTGNSECNNADL